MASVKVEIGLALLLLSAAAQAQEGTAALEERLAAQEARIGEEDARLKAQEARLQAQEARLQAQEARSRERDQTLRQRILGLGPDGFVFGTRDSGFQLRIRGVVQADGRAYFGTGVNQPLPDQFLVRRARPILEGT